MQRNPPTVSENDPTPVVTDEGHDGGKARTMTPGQAPRGRGPAGRVRRHAGSVSWADLGGRYGVILVLLAIPVFFSIGWTSEYFTTGNLDTILSTQAVQVFVTLGLTAPLIVNEFDLSIGGQLGFSATLVAVLTVNDHVGVALAILACLGSGVVLGVINSLIVVKAGVNSFITTLGTGTVLLGLTLEISGSTEIVGVPNALVTPVSGTHIAGLSLAVLYALILAMVLWYVYEQTPLGRYMYFTGFGREAARLSGIRVDALRIGALVFCAMIATVAGLLETGTLGASDPSAGNDFLLPAFAGAFLGATTIKVGRFNAWGAFLAVYLLASGITGLEIAGLSGWIDQVFNGVALVAAVMFATFMARRVTASEVRASTPADDASG